MSGEGRHGGENIESNLDDGEEKNGGGGKSRVKRRERERGGIRFLLLGHRKHHLRGSVAMGD